jgi:hypothetical protein
MKSRIARKIVKSWPAKCWRYRKSTMQRAFRLCSFKVIDNKDPVIFVPTTFLGYPVVIDEQGPYSFNAAFISHKRKP